MSVIKSPQTFERALPAARCPAQPYARTHAPTNAHTLGIRIICKCIEVDWSSDRPQRNRCCTAAFPSNFTILNHCEYSLSRAAGDFGGGKEDTERNTSLGDSPCSKELLHCVCRCAHFREPTSGGWASTEPGGRPVDRKVRSGWMGPRFLCRGPLRRNSYRGSSGYAGARCRAEWSERAALPGYFQPRAEPALALLERRDAKRRRSSAQQAEQPTLLSLRDSVVSLRSFCLCP